MHNRQDQEGKIWKGFGSHLCTFLQGHVGQVRWTNPGALEGTGADLHHNTPFFNGGLVARVSPQFLRRHFFGYDFPFRPYPLLAQSDVTLYLSLIE